MYRMPRATLLGVLALFALSACSDSSPTDVVTPTEAKVASFAFAPAAVAENVFVNGSFEEGDFTGWIAAGDFLIAPWAVAPAGAGGGSGLVVTTPPDGVFSAWNGFEAIPFPVPVFASLTQTTTLPSANVRVSFQYRVQWNLLTLGAEARTYTVELHDPVAATPPVTLLSGSIGTGDLSGDTGWQTVTFDYAGTAGQSVEIFVAQAFPADLMPGSAPVGPAQFEVDNFSLVSLDAAADPTTKDQCKNGGWEAFGFKNQGQCVRFVETGKDSR